MVMHGFTGEIRCSRSEPVTVKQRSHSGSRHVRANTLDKLNHDVKTGRVLVGAKEMQKERMVHIGKTAAKTKVGMNKMLY